MSVDAPVGRVQRAVTEVRRPAAEKATKYVAHLRPRARLARSQQVADLALIRVRLFIGEDDGGGGEAVLGEIASDHIDAVERGFGGDGDSDTAARVRTVLGLLLIRLRFLFFSRFAPSGKLARHFQLCDPLNGLEEAVEHATALADGVVDLPDSKRGR